MTGATTERFGDPDLWVQRTPVGWSPEGEFDVFMRDLTTQRTIKLTQNPGRDTSPSLSPDGAALWSPAEGNHGTRVREHHLRGG